MDRDTLPAIPEAAVPIARSAPTKLAAVGMTAHLVGARYLDWAADDLVRWNAEYSDSGQYAVVEAIERLRSLARQLREGT